MNDIPNDADTASARRKRLTARTLAAMRSLTIQVGLLNHQVSARVALNDIDLDCLDLIARHGPFSPTALARRAGLHPATLTGVLDRLERGGWINRDRDPHDRRAVVIRVRRERVTELTGHYAGMLQAMSAICASYDERDLETLLDFLTRAAQAGRDATSDLAAT